MKLSQRLTSGRMLRSLGAALTAFVGVIFLMRAPEPWEEARVRPSGLTLAIESAGEWFSDRSYDWMFRFRPPTDVSDEPVVVVAMDQKSADLRRYKSANDWSREWHSQLIPQLFSLGARAVAFDVLFPVTNGLNSVDLALLSAATNHSAVFFGARLGKTEHDGEGVLRSFGANSLPLSRSGFTEHVYGARRNVRQHWIGHDLRFGDGIRSLQWLMAHEWTGDFPRDGSRWVNYYGPPQSIRYVSYHTVFSNELARPFITNRLVYVGSTLALGGPGGSGTDTVDHPYEFRDQQPMPGVEVNATVCLNLIRRDWLRRLPFPAEVLLFGILGWMTGAGLCRLRPGMALLVGFLAAGVAVVVCVLVLAEWRTWCPWLVYVAAQIPVAIGWCTLVRNASLQRDKQTLERKLAESAASAAATHVPAASAGALSIPSATAGGPGSAPAIPDHTMLRCVGRGSYGEVWLARDAIGSYHAVKIIYRSAFESDGPFEREFRGMQKYTPISRTHPGLVHVLHVGRNDALGYFFYIMEVGDDEERAQIIEPDSYRAKNLAREVRRRGRLPVAECVQTGIALCDALQHLHNEKLVHRDIKPSNVIFVRGAPKFADIGLVTEARSRHGDASMLGTEGFIAPEGPGTPAADVFSLGKLLYEISMGRDRLAFPELPESLLEEGQWQEVQPLNDIIIKACEHEPADRYPSAEVLRADLITLREWLNARHSAPPKFGNNVRSEGEAE